MTAAGRELPREAVEKVASNQSNETGGLTDVCYELGSNGAMWLLRKDEEIRRCLQR